MKTPAVEFIKVTKQFNGDPAVYDLNLALSPGEILALVGPSGCGKTTSLRLVAGFEQPDAGEIILDGKTVAGGRQFVQPENRGVGMVFQDYALFPHLNVLANVAFGLNGTSKARRLEEAESMLNLVGLTGYGQRLPHELSGGERQRVALARALAPRPILVLLDEPFSNLDADLRVRMREEVRAILKGMGATAIFVTHDQEEALFIGDRLAVLHHGRLEQIGTPEEVFHQPVNHFVAEFMGGSDFLPGEVVSGGIKTEIGIVQQEIDLPVGTQVELALRADDVHFTPDTKTNSLILARHFKGALNVYRLRLPSGRLLHAFGPHTEALRPGTPVKISIQPGHGLACFPLEETLRNSK